MLLGRGLCDELIVSPEEPCRLWCVIDCDLETSRMRRPWPAFCLSATGVKKEVYSSNYLSEQEIGSVCSHVVCCIARSFAHLHTALRCRGFLLSYFDVFMTLNFFQIAVLILTPCGLVDYFEVKLLFKPLAPQMDI